jgi:hypothetical protein
MAIELMRSCTFDKKVFYAAPLGANAQALIKIAFLHCARSNPAGTKAA